MQALKNYLQDLGNKIRKENTNNSYTNQFSYIMCQTNGRYAEILKILFTIVEVDRQTKKLWTVETLTALL